MTLKSQRKQWHDEPWMKQSTATGIQSDSGGGLSTGGWRRRSLFSSERLDLILSNLRRNLSKSVDSDRCKQISHAQVIQQQQQQHGAGKHVYISILLEGELTTLMLITLQNGRVVSLCRHLTSCDASCDARYMVILCNCTVWPTLTLAVSEKTRDAQYYLEHAFLHKSYQKLVKGHLRSPTIVWIGGTYTTSFRDITTCLWIRSLCDTQGPGTIPNFEYDR